MLVALLPIYWIGVSAYRRYKVDGRFTGRVFSIAVFAVLPFAYMAAMALGYSISGLWPLGIIVVGVSFLLLAGSK
jgi:fatty acid desaturase